MLPWGQLVANSCQNFGGTSIDRSGQFKAKTGEFGQGLVGEVVSRKFVTPGRYYKDPSRVLKTNFTGLSHPCSRRSAVVLIIKRFYCCNVNSFHAYI